MPSAKEIAGSIVNSASSTVSGAVQGYQTRNATDAAETVEAFRASQDIFTVGPEITKALGVIFDGARKHARTRTSGQDLKAVTKIIDDGEKKVRGIIERGTEPATAKIRDKATRMANALG